jgi:sigma-B regulation protein RsbU (phosphoserine phosphatase)
MDAALGAPDDPSTSSADVRGDAEMTRALEQAAFLQNVSLQLAGSLNVRRTLLQLLHMATPRLGDWAMLALFEGDDATLVARGVDGKVSEQVSISLLDEERSGLDRIRRVGQTELLHVTLDPAPAGGLSTMIPHEGLREEAAALRPADVLGVGLNARGSTLGALVVVRRENRGYDDSDVEMVEDFARRAALTLDSARLYEERTSVASVLQASLRPPSLPEVPGLRVAARYRPAMEHMDIGGDFYDVHGGEDDWSFVIGDVCGKGVHAAVLTGRARQTIRTAAHFDRSPATILSALNDVLYEEDSDRFVTVACGRLRTCPATGGVDLTLAVAGHPAPLVVRADGRVEEPGVTGTLSGVLPHLSYEETTISLRPGDLVLLYTDGIYEAKGPEGFFGIERLREILSRYAGAEPNVVCEAVEQRVIEHLDGLAHDDMALLALRCGE